MARAEVDVVLPALALIFFGCAPHRPVISGDFGEIDPPNQDQVALIWNKSGDSTVVRRIQEDNDTLFLQTLDFDIFPMSKDEVSRIEVRPISDMEKSGGERAAVNQLAKDAAVGIGGQAAMWMAVVVPFIILGFVINSYRDSLSK